MAILKIAKMGHPILLQKAKEVDDPTDPKIKVLVDDMLETLDDLGNGVGLAAPQVHVSLQVVIFETLSDDGKEANLITLINPKIDILTTPRSNTFKVRIQTGNNAVATGGLTGANYILILHFNKVKNENRTY